jgi:hypothetical protein
MSTETAVASSEPGLRAELRAIEHAHPHWHVWLSDEGRVWAVCLHLPFRSSGGVTVDGSTPEQIGREIAVVEHAWEMAA